MNQYFDSPILMLSDSAKAMIQYSLPKKALTSLAGLLANIKIPAIKNRLIRYFIQKYDINLQEALEENPAHYPTFNDFFIRHLKPECRPIANADIVSPVDGYISQLGRIHEGTLLQAKGQSYFAHELLACKKEQSALFDKGLFATLYLSPQDYHRIHMPLNATLSSMIYVPGKLFSVQPATARMIPKLFAENERLVVFFETTVGLMAMVLVGATIVGAIGTTWHGDLARRRERRHFNYSDSMALLKGQEMGYFKLGSTVILLFANGEQVSWHEALNPGDKIQFGQAFGTIKNN